MNWRQCPNEWRKSTSGNLNNYIIYTGVIFETTIDSLSRRGDNLIVGGIAAPTRAVATRKQVLTTAKALETGAASGRI